MWAFLSLLAFSTLIIVCSAGPCTVNDVGILTGTNCEAQYLTMLSNISKKNIYNNNGRGQTQWAAIGFNRRVTNPEGTDDIRKYPDVFPADAKGLQTPKPLTNKFCMYAFIKDIDTTADYAVGSNAYKNFGYDGNTHTERQLRNALYDPTFTIYEPITEVYLYTYNTPCFRGCSREILDNIVAKVKLLNPPNTIVRYNIGFHSEYKRNDDLQVWLSYDLYREQKPTMASPLPVDKWKVFPLQGTFQSILVDRLMNDALTKAKFCEKCKLKPAASAFPTDTSQRRRAINYLVEALLYQMAEEKCGKTIAQCVADYDRNARDVYIPLRRPEDWANRLSVLNSDRRALFVHSQIFRDVLNYEDTDTTKFFTRLLRAEDIEAAGRIAPIGPPIMPRDFYPLGINPDSNNLDANWMITCDNGYTGRLCEYAQAENPTLDYMNRFIGIIGPSTALDYQWQLTDWVFAENDVLQKPGIFFVYGGNGAWKDWVLFIGYGTNLRAAVLLAQNTYKLGIPSDDNKIAQAASQIAFVQLDKSEQELVAYINVLKTVFCTYAEPIKSGGTEFSSKCHINAAGQPVNPIMAVKYFDEHVYDRMAQYTRNPIGAMPSIPQRLLDTPSKANFPAYAGQESCLIA